MTGEGGQGVTVQSTGINGEKGKTVGTEETVTGTEKVAERNTENEIEAAKGTEAGRDTKGDAKVKQDGNVAKVEDFLEFMVQLL